MESHFYSQLKSHPFQHGFISPKAFKKYVNMWIQGDLDLDLYDEDYERMERYNMAYEEALVRHKDSWEKRHKAMVRYKKYHAHSFTVECPKEKKKAIMELPLPDVLLKMIYDYIYPYKVSHVSYEHSLFRYRMKRQGKMNKTIERYWKSFEKKINENDITYVDPYYDYHSQLEYVLMDHLNYIENDEKTGVICGPLRRFDQWYKQ
tara:strand:- start:346 stop:960 length:615 start_codon:yes stop_codon:yes gene_type:complete